MPRSLKKGPFVDDHLLKKVDVLNEQGQKTVIKDLVAPLHDHPRHDRPHHRRARRPQARPGLRDRGDGRPQARRVRSHPDLQVPRRAGGRARRDVDDGHHHVRPRKTNERPACAPLHRHARFSAYKAREVLDLIRGKSVSRPAPSSSSATARLPTSSSRCSTPRSPTPEQQRHPAGGALRRRVLRGRGPDHESAGARVPAAVPRGSASAPATSR